MPDKMWIPNGLQPEKKKPAKAKLRVINQGTNYDITGHPRKVAREMERGEIDVTDVCLIRRDRDGRIIAYHIGTNGGEMAHFMLATAKNRIEPA